MNKTYHSVRLPVSPRVWYSGTEVGMMEGKGLMEVGEARAVLVGSFGNWTASVIILKTVSKDDC